MFDKVIANYIETIVKPTISHDFFSSFNINIIAIHLSDLLFLHKIMIRNTFDGSIWKNHAISGLWTALYRLWNDNVI